MFLLIAAVIDVANTATNQDSQYSIKIFQCNKDSGQDSTHLQKFPVWEGDVKGLSSEIYHYTNRQLQSSTPIAEVSLCWPSLPLNSVLWIGEQKKMSPLTPLSDSPILLHFAFDVVPVSWWPEESLLAITSLIFYITNLYSHHTVRFPLFLH